MTPLLALVSTGVGVFALCWLDRDKQHRISKALTIPLVWILIGSSRPVTEWVSFLPQGANYQDGSPIDRTVLTLLLLLGLIVLSRKGNQVKAILRANTPILIFFVYCFLSILWSDFPFVTFKRWIRGAADVVMVLIIMTEPEPDNAVKALLNRLLFLVIPASVLLIKFFPEYGRSYSIGGVQMWTGVCTDKNGLGAICMVFGSALLWRLLPTNRSQTSHSWCQWIAKVTVFAMVLYLVWVIDSKTALICFAIADVIIVLTWLTRLCLRPVIATMLVWGMIGFCYCILFLGVGGDWLSVLGRNSTLTGRTDIWATVLPLVTNPVLGAGYENFWMGDRFAAFARNLVIANQAHNGYLEVYLNLGWCGLILLSVIVLTGYRNIMRSLRSEPEKGRLKLAFFAVCMVYNFTEANFKMMSPVWIVFLWATMVIPKPRPAAAKPTAAWPNHPAISTIGASDVSQTQPAAPSLAN